MNIKEFNELYKNIMDNHSWYKRHETISARRKLIKYVECSIDTRDGSIWMVRLRGHGIAKEFKFNNIVEQIKNWLKEKNNE